MEHVRLLDDFFALEPASDITAILTRPAGTRCEIRLDFLDLPNPPQYDFTLILGGRVAVFSSDSTPPKDARLEVDPVTDTILVSLANCAPSAGIPLVVETASERLVTTFGARSTLQPVTVQFAFTNTFASAATPTQALRRWDGAHSGPRGERHGLHGLLDAAEKHQIPLTLFGIQSPVVLSAIDAVGGTRQLRRMEKNGLLELPGSITPPSPTLDFEIGRNGLPLDTRRALLTAVSPLTLGGDFARSTWGTYEYAEPSFSWLAARPYLVVFADPPTDKPDMPTGKPVDSILASAREMESMLANADPELAQNYAGLVTVMETAAAWSENPAPQVSCRAVQLRDEQISDLCILASDKFYAVLNPLGGRLVFFFAGKQQIIGPTAQFFVGLSDRSQWDLSKGEGADPAQVMGAFADADDAFRTYTAEITENAIRFVSADEREKTYRLTEYGLDVTLSGPFETKIPLALAPQTRFMPGWVSRYHLELLVDGIRSGVAGGLRVRIQASAGSVRAVDSFLDAIPSLASPENPNVELSPGFFLPFPITVVHLTAPETAQVILTVR